jgi:phosphoglycerate dehydrogenase-like enzyme
MTDAAKLVVGVYHSAPGPLLPLIREAAPEADVRVCTTSDGIAGILDDVEVLLAFKFGFKPFPRDAILAAPRLKWVQLASAGVDHMLPFDPARLLVTNGSGLHGEIISQFVFGALAQLTWDFPRLLRQQAAHRWERYPVASLSGKTMGILGIGSIGACLARYARVYGMRVIGTRRSGLPAEGVARTYLPDATTEVLSRSDVVVVATPLTAETRNLVGAVELAAMPRSAYLVVISRGGVVSEPALVDALRQGQLAGAVLDVFTEEPLPADSPFWDLPNAIVTPHISGELSDWPVAVARLFADNLKRYLAAEPLRNLVDPQRGY